MGFEHRTSWVGRTGRRGRGIDRGVRAAWVDATADRGKDETDRATRRLIERFRPAEEGTAGPGREAP